MSGCLRKTDGEEVAGEKGRRPGRGGAGEESRSPLHTADNQQQLGHTLQVETTGAVLGDVPCLRGTCGEKEEAVTTWPARPPTAAVMLVTHRTARDAVAATM